MPTIHQSSNPLKDALAKVATVANLDQITALRIAKDFAFSQDAFVGFEGRDKNGQYFQLRVDYDPTKKGHVNVMINGNDRHEYVGETHTWYTQVIDNINGGSYCNVPRNIEKSG